MEDCGLCVGMNWDYVYPVQGTCNRRGLGRDKAEMNWEFYLSRGSEDGQPLVVIHAG